MQPIAIRLRTQRQRLVAESEADVHAALTRAEQEADSAGSLALVDFQAANGNMISLVVGGADIALSFRYDGDVEPRFLSLGNPSARGSFPCSRDFTRHIHCPRWALVSRLAGLTALEEFVNSNELPGCIEWAPFSA